MILPNVYINMHTRSSAGITGNGKTAYLRDEVQLRDVAQLGSAPEWGSGGRRFESGRPDLGRINSHKALRPVGGVAAGAARMARVAPFAPVTSPSHDVLGECSAARPR